MDTIIILEMLSAKLGAADEMCNALARIGYARRGTPEENMSIDELAEIARKAETQTDTCVLWVDR